MKKHLLWKDAWQAIPRSLGRFIAIFLLMAVSAFALVGLKLTGPDMRQAATDFYRQTKLADLSITSNYGLSKADQRTIKHLAGVKTVEFGSLQDSQLSGSRRSLRIMSKTSKLSTSQLVSGRLPKESNEIALSYLLKGKYHQGETITLKTAGSLKHRRFKVVGFVRASEYLDRFNIGQTTVGTGQLTGVAIVTKSAFTSSTPTIARVSFTATAKLNPFSTRYQHLVNHKQSQLQTALNRHRAKRWRARQKQIKQLEAALTQAKALAATSSAAASQAKQLSATLTTLKQTGKPTYTVNTREENPGYAVYRSNAERVDILANIFPVLMFAIAALVALTTMTRFVEEERIAIGTLKALGYSNADVAKKFVLYSLLAATGGTLLGAAGGFWLLPRVIFNAYAANSTITKLTLNFSWTWLLVTLAIAIASTTLAALWALHQDAREMPASLLLPKPPKGGARIMLERVTPLWRHLSFNAKVTARNLFRYKTRMLMTIFGVAGCTGLLVMGFGIRDSLSGISTQQYEHIIRYDLLAVKKSKLTSQQESKLAAALKSSNVKRHTSVHTATLTRRFSSDPQTQSVTMIVPRSTSALKKYLTLTQRTPNKKLTLSNHGVVISEKLAKLAKVAVGDKIRLKDSNGHWHRFKVAGITEMYMGHFLLMNKHEYYHYFHRHYSSNAELITLKHGSGSRLQKTAAKLMASGALQTINENTSNKKTINTIMDSLGQVIWILIALATILALVVIYNLTNINVAERMRELSTIKVLGFYDGEVTMYIYRETIVLSLLGILVGFLLGKGLHTFIITALPPTYAMFDPTMTVANFCFSALIPAVITAALALVIHHQIRTVAMLDALKSVD